jgi:hypothetical protein
VAEVPRFDIEAANALETGMNFRAIMRSPWVHTLLWTLGFIGYHFLISAVYPTSGVIIRSTFPLYAIVRPACNRWAILPLLVFAAWLLVLRWHQHRGFARVSVSLAIFFVLALNVTMAMTRGGPPALHAPFTRITPEAKAEYLADVDRVADNPVKFTRDYSRLAPTLSLHSGTHPPGAVLYLWLVSRIVGKGIRTAAWAAIIGTSLAIIPFHLLARTLYNERVSWYAVAMYVVTPSLVLFGATSMDGVFLFFPILAAYFFHTSWKRGPIPYSILTGLTLVVAMFFTFVTVAIGLIFTLEAILSYRVFPLWGRVWKNLVYAGATFAVTYCIIYWLTGYNVIDAFRSATRLSEVYRGSIYIDLAQYFHISVTNLMAFFIGTGVVTTALWWRHIVHASSQWITRSASTDFVQLAFTLAILLLAFSTIFCMETERVWMFLMPFAILAAAKELDRYQQAHQRPNTWQVVLILLFSQTFATQLLLYTHW